MLYILVNGNCEKIEEELNLKTSTIIDNCLERTTKGCIRCNDGYYLDNYECKQCVYPCKNCINSTYCLSCDEYSNLNDGTCVSMNELIKICNNMWPNNHGCINCKEGYYKSEDGRNCDECDKSCKTCINKDTCLSCNDNYYLIPESTQKLCKHMNESIGCINITQSGCLQCKEGMYLSNYECFNCPHECKTCTNENQCQTCQEEYVLKEQQCIHYKQIEHCKSASNSVCNDCEVGYELNDNKNECHLRIGWIIGLPLFAAVIIVISIIIVLIIILKQIGKHQDYQELSNLQIFKISKLNTELYKLSDTIISNKQMLDFNDENGDIPVNKESNIFVINGNNSNNIQTRKY